MRYEYCPLCGEKTQLRQLGDEGDVPWCEGCGRPFFDGFAVCVLSVVVSGEEICLIRQSYGDTNKYVGVAGYVKCGETAEEAACREVQEEIGIVPESVRFLSSHFYQGRDQLMLGFLARVSKQELRISGELCEARWFSAREAEKTVRQGSIIHKLVIQAVKLIEGGQENESQ